MSNKPPAFLLCENPMADEVHGHREYIAYMRTPVIIAQVIDYSDMDEADVLMIKNEISVGSALDLGGEYFLFSAIYVDPTYSVGKDAQVVADKLAGIMRRMADWYEAYIKWEDNFNNKEQ